VLLCDLSGQSHAQAAKSLGLAKGTITKRLARAREELASRLTRRNIALGAGALATMIATTAHASVPAPLVLETARQAVAFSIGQLSGAQTTKTLAEGIMRSFKIGVLKVWLVVGLLGLTLAAGGLMLASGPTDPGENKTVQPQAQQDAKPDAPKAPSAPKALTTWRESYTTECEGFLPVSVAFSADGKTLLTGNSNGEVTALILARDYQTHRWQTSVGGSHAAVAYSADQKNVYATTTNGVCILDAATGTHIDRIEQGAPNPIAIGVFPNKDGRGRIVFGNARSHYLMDWPLDQKPSQGVGGGETSDVAKGAKPADMLAVTFAVDPKRRSVVMMGDAGHTANVVSVTWATGGSTAVTGDADGRVILWDAQTNKESGRVELGGRVVALAISGDGAHTAALVCGKRGGEVYVWESAKPARALKPIHTQQADFSFEPCGSLAFSADGKHLAGCVIDKRWLKPYPKSQLYSQIHVWDLAAAPKDQPAPNRLYEVPLPRSTSPTCVIQNNWSMLTFGAQDGAINFGDIRFGYLQGRTHLGKFALGAIKASADRKWLAIEQHPLAQDPGVGGPATTCDVGVYYWPRTNKATIPSCTRLLDIATGGQIVAVVRDKQIELWDSATVKKAKTAPFKHTRIDAAQFSPDGKLLAISDRNDLVLWRWEDNTHERIDLGRRVGSLAFTPDGRFLAEGPTPGDDIRIRAMATYKVVQTLSAGTRRPLNVARLAYTQGGRVLIACDNPVGEKVSTEPHRIIFWDTATDSIAHQIALPAGLLSSIDVSPSGRYLAAMQGNADSGMTLTVWRLDGQPPVVEQPPFPPAADRPR
jgi:WD40 repeat protein